MKIMSIDYGESRTGIAICDENEVIAYPHCVIFQKKYLALCEKIVDIVNELNIELVVIGNPKNMNGSEGIRSKKSLKLASFIKRKANVKVELFDERMTTITATNILNNANIRGKDRKNVIDAVAATIILESFLSYKKNKEDTR